MNKKLLQIAGVRVLAFIEENIKKGVDYEGNPFEYSDKPFWRPFDPAIYKKLGGSKAQNNNIFKITTSKLSGKKGIVILGGYKYFKRTFFPSSANHFLTATGSMLRSMNLQTNETEAVISFSGNENVKKAFFLNVSGAGRSRKLWKFLGITNSQKEILKKEIEANLASIIIDKFAKLKVY